MNVHLSFVVYETPEPRQIQTYYGKYNLGVEVTNPENGAILWESDTTFDYPDSLAECLDLARKIDAMDYADLNLGFEITGGTKDSHVTLRQVDPDSDVEDQEISL